MLVSAPHQVHVMGGEAEGETGASGMVLSSPPTPSQAFAWGLLSGHFEFSEMSLQLVNFPLCYEPA